MRIVPVLNLPLALCLAVIAMAHGPTVTSVPANPEQLLRNRALIRDLVLSSLKLAAEDDPLSRADQCHSLAERVVDEIRVSASSQEFDRAVQLSDHLHSMLKLGVAGNLRIVRFESSPSSAREIDVQRVGGQVRDLMEQFLTGQNEEAIELRRVIRNVRDGQAEVDKVLQVRTEP